MQKQLSSLQILFRNEGFAHLAYKVISFLDIQTVEAVIDIDGQQCNCQHLKEIKKLSQSQVRKPYILDMLQSIYFISQYMNHTDRSMYYSFYQESEFKQNQKSHAQSIIIQQSLTQRQHQTFSKSYKKIKNIFTSIEKSSLLSFDELQEVKRMFIDPSLPLPSIKRENQGMYCNSSFQLYLVGLRFPHYGQHEGMGGFNVFEELQQRLQDQEEQCFKMFFQIQKNKHSTKKLYQNLHLVRYMPYEITCFNLSQLLLQNNTAHNLIVYMFALTDVWINSIVLYVESITDPYYKFIELMSRYAMFKSLVIELQELLGFLFRSYQSLYSDTIRDSIFSSSVIKPKYCFWRPALTKWFMKMKSLHKETGDVYFLLLTKLREEKLMEKIECSQGEGETTALIKKHQICLKNNLQINNMTQQLKTNLYSQSHGQSIIQNFIYNDQLTCQSLVFQYVQYMIDLSINEQTVHWCGHSMHKLGKAFGGFLEEFLNYNYRYYSNLNEKVIDGVSEGKEKGELVIELIKDDIQFLEVKNVKAVVLRKVVEGINCNGEKFNEVETQKNMKQFTQFYDKMQQQNQIISSPPLIQMDFTQKDNKLKYFNQKARICQSIQGEQKYFFQIPPQLSPQQILSKSINTNDSSENEENDGDEGYQYVSEDQGEEMTKGKCVKWDQNLNQMEDENELQQENQQNNHINNQMDNQMENQNNDNNHNKNKNKNKNKSNEDMSHLLKVSQNSTAQSSQLENAKDNQLQNFQDQITNQTKNQTNSQAEQHLQHPIFKTNSF